MLAWFHKSRTAHNLKDLEKALPAAASISGMQVKGECLRYLRARAHTDATAVDYIQALQDDSKIICEKIGSGNWYWSFPSEAKRQKEVYLDKIRKDHEKTSAVVTDLRHKLAQRAAQLEEEEDTAGGGGDNRQELMSKITVLEEDLKTLSKELETYADKDPTELERKKTESKSLLDDAERYTDEIDSIEGWFSKQGDAEQFLATCRMGFYGDEWDTEEYCLKGIAHSG